ncbi:phosphotransferase [Roseococcus sp.]|uniref:phosphotransferase n=1 Tax=Roseococcus sp. TaxID=2109646 RepID=UPI003BA9B244
MTIRPPTIALGTARDVARALWGIEAQPRPLRGERDANFRLRAEDGRQYVLKFANPAEDARYRDMQLGALRHIERKAPELEVPRVIALPDGATEARVTDASGVAYQVRLLSWIEGLPLGMSRRSAAQRDAAGTILARLQAALAGFAHAATATPIIWDLAHALALREVADVLPAELRAALLPILDDFEAKVTPIQGGLRRQVLHNDLNQANVMVDAADHDRIAGVIDFGDMAETAIVFDAAIAAYCHFGDDMPIAEAAGHLLRRYCAMSPLREEEIEILPLLMATRAATSATLACYHRHAQPDNDHYSVTAEDLRRRVARIIELRAPDVVRALHAACRHPA